MDLGEKIRRWRLREGWSQQGLADRLDISRAAVSQWETGVCSPTHENLVSMAGVFGVSLGTFVDSPPKRAQ